MRAPRRCRQGHCCRPPCPAPRTHRCLPAAPGEGLVLGKLFVTSGAAPQTRVLAQPSALVAITRQNSKLAVLHYSKQSGSNSARGRREHRRAARCRAGMAEGPRVHQVQRSAESAQEGGKSLQQEVKCSFSASVGQPKYIPPSKHILNLNPVSQQNALLISGEI